MDGGALILSLAGIIQTSRINLKAGMGHKRQKNKQWTVWNMIKVILGFALKVLQWAVTGCVFCFSMVGIAFVFSSQEGRAEACRPEVLHTMIRFLRIYYFFFSMMYLTGRYCLNLGKIPDEWTDDGWMPCKFHYPEPSVVDDGREDVHPVLVTYKSVFDGESAVANQCAIYIGAGKWKWYDDTIDIEDMEDVRCEIVAWRPLLEFYQPKGE